MSEPTTEEAKQIRRIRAYLKAFLDAIQESADTTLGGLPEGHIYATVMGMMSLDTFQVLIGQLEKGGYITRENHLCKATGKQLPFTTGF